MTWWSRGATRLDILRMASCYLGPLVFFLGLFKASRFKPAAAIITTFGVFETLRTLHELPSPTLLSSDARTAFFAALSIIGHVLVYAPFFRMPVDDPVDALRTSAALLLAAVFVYALTDSWPYCTPPMHVLPLCLGIGFVSVF